MAGPRADEVVDHRHRAGGLARNLHRGRMAGDGLLDPADAIAAWATPRKPARRTAQAAAPRLLPETAQDAQPEARPDTLPDARMMSEIGWLQRCNHCNEYWPADAEFFPRDVRRTHGIELTCKACRKERRRTQDGADEPMAEAQAA